MKRIGIALMALVLMGVGQAMAAPPVVSNVQVEIIDNLTPETATPKGRVKITYDVADPDGDPLFVFVSATKVANNWNETSLVPMETLSGDFTTWDRTAPQMPTANITPGTGKEIIWDAPADWPNMETTNMQVQVRAYDGDMNQISVLLDSTLGTTMEFIYVKPGSYTNRSGQNVTIEQGFYLGKTEVTHRQYYAGASPRNSNITNSFMSSGLDTLDTPLWVGSPSNNRYTSFYYLADYYPRLLISKLQNGQYRIPTSDEWEYAARAGTTTAFYFGDDVNQLGGYEWHQGNYAGLLKEPRGKWPNPWGFYDMLGNSREITSATPYGFSGSTYTVIWRGQNSNQSAGNFANYPLQNQNVGSTYYGYTRWYDSGTIRLVRTGP